MSFRSLAGLVLIGAIIVAAQNIEQEELKTTGVVKKINHTPVEEFSFKPIYINVNLKKDSVLD